MFYHTQRRLKYSMQDACSYPYSHIWRNQESLHTNLSHNSENQCLPQMLKVMKIRRRYIIKAFKDSNRYEHVSLKISVWQSQQRKDHKVIQEVKLNKSKIKIKLSHQVLKIMIKPLKIELPKHIKWSTPTTTS